MTAELRENICEELNSKSHMQSEMHMKSASELISSYIKMQWKKQQLNLDCKI